jgi:hypothetical protein
MLFVFLHPPIEPDVQLSPAILEAPHQVHPLLLLQRVLYHRRLHDVLGEKPTEGIVPLSAIAPEAPRVKKEEEVGSFGDYFSGSLDKKPPSLRAREAFFRAKALPMHL